MKVLIVVVVALLSAAYAAKPLRILSVEETTAFDYHNRVGIPEAKRIQAEEEQLLADPSRIVGGSPAWHGQFRYQVGLLLRIWAGTSVCGGSIIASNRVLTAAHCCTGVNMFEIVMGSTTLFTGGTRTTTPNSMIHPNYSSSTLNHDIAVILTSWINFNNYIQPIPLATGNNDFAGMWATASGFGRTSDSATGAIQSNQTLSYVNLLVITNALCQQTYGANVIVPSTMCTSGANGQGTCGGDSGGPLTINNRQVGVVSFGAAAGCQVGLPAGFMRVTHYVSWINSTFTD